MLSEIHIVAPAKINLGLNVLPHRKDGFHSIESIFQAVSLKDELFVALEEGFGKCDVSCDGLVLPEENTVTAAYKAFGAAAGIQPLSVRVKLVKKIPSGGGLGGGSSDAAFFVRALEKLHGVTLTEEQLDFIAARVGSDVFFFFHCDDDGTGAAVVSGRGEFVRKIPCRPDLHIVLAFPEVHSSTKEAYSLVDAWFESGEVIEHPVLSELECMYNAPVSDWRFKNTFTIPLTAQYQKIGAALECVRRSGALYSEMSGSGSTVFGVYASRAEAENAAGFMDCEGLKNTVVC